MNDKQLEALLSVNEITLTAREVEAILEGLVAAPSMDPSQWLDLIGSNVNKDLVEVLIARKAEINKATDAGFTEGPAPVERVEKLREALSKQSIDGFIVPRTDEFQGEYVPARSDRLRWLTGFSGSAGTAIILQNKAAIFVDGRYTIQVKSEVNSSNFEIFNSSDTPPHKWLAAQLSKGMKFAVDPWLYTKNGMKLVADAAKSVDAELVYLSSNPVDEVWAGQPSAPLAPISIQSLTHAGIGSANKRLDLGVDIGKRGADVAVITATDSIAWILNIRGRDVPNCPLPLSFGLLHKDGLFDLFIDARKLTPVIHDYLGNEVSVKPIGEFEDALVALGKTGKTILADPATSADQVFQKLDAGGAHIINGADPCLMAKACKNDVELNGTRAAHKRDGAKVSRFLSWMDGLDKGQSIYELDAVAKLAELRGEDPLFRDESFDTISGSGPNGAICHYRVSAASNRKLNKIDMLLVDSGGQYLDGTTDITRTIAIGTPTDEMKRNFTLVLKGHIALATQRFPAGITGSNLDALARAPLWAEGLDYDHGTGHGVGSYLNVHEGPQRISKGPSTIALKPGMILSNEPGYYKDGEYGIRIESLVIVKLARKGENGNKDILEFETITFAPIDLNLVNREMLSDKEANWLNDYHQQVKSVVAPQVNNDVKAWLEHATRSI